MNAIVREACPSTESEQDQAPRRYCMSSGNCHQEENMRGRFGLFAEMDALAEQFNFDPAIMRDIYSPRWNIPPTVPILTVQPSSSGGPVRQEYRRTAAPGNDRSAQSAIQGKQPPAVQRPRGDCA